MTAEDEARAEAEDALAFYDTYRVMSSATACVEALRTLLAASRREPSEASANVSNRPKDDISSGEMSVSEPSDTDERSIEEKYFETLAKIDPSKEMARVIAQARRDLAKRRDADEREWEYADLYDSKGYHVAMQRRTKATDAAPAGEWEVFPDAV